jgi:PQQ-dependent catabolism-associated CXXCW motif protein
MFMGGESRTFSDAFRPALTFVGIHGAFDKTTLQPVFRLSTQIFAFYKYQMAEPFNADVINKALYEMDDPGALLKVYDAYRTPKQIPFHCRSAETPRKDCTEFKDSDAYSLGVVTSVALTHVDLPEVFKTVPRIAGTDLTVALSDPDVYYQELAAKQCPNDSCSAISGYASKLENKALAIPFDDTGYGIDSNGDSAIQAFYRALYFCNHPHSKAPRLCEVQMVNGYDLRPVYKDARLSHVKALAELHEPSAKYYGNEEYGGSFTTTHGLRTIQVHDMTPPTLDGIRTLTTKDLAALLKSDKSPVLIDVWAGADEVIPSAITLAAGGLAFENSSADAAYEARFSGLLKLLSPDMDKPIIFYCMSRECWLSANAAMRAQKLGYSQVAWYRGGWTSWKAASLPTAKPLINAIVN